MRINDSIRSESKTVVRAATRDFQQCGILTSLTQPAFKLDTPCF